MTLQKRLPDPYHPRTDVPSRRPSYDRDASFWFWGPAGHWTPTSQRSSSRAASTYHSTSTHRHYSGSTTFLHPPWERASIHNRSIQQICQTEAWGSGGCIRGAGSRGRGGQARNGGPFEKPVHGRRQCRDRPMFSLRPTTIVIRGKFSDSSSTPGSHPCLKHFCS